MVDILDPQTRHELLQSLHQRAIGSLGVGLPARWGHNGLREVRKQCRPCQIVAPGLAEFPGRTLPVTADDLHLDTCKLQYHFVEDPGVLHPQRAALLKPSVFQFLSCYSDMGVDDGTGAELVEFDHHFAGAFSVHVTIAVQYNVVVDFCDHFSSDFIEV